MPSNWWEKQGNDGGVDQNWWAWDIGTSQAGDAGKAAGAWGNAGNNALGGAAAGTWENIKGGAGAIPKAGGALKDAAVGAGKTIMDELAGGDGWTPLHYPYDESQYAQHRQNQAGARGDQGWLVDQYRRQASGYGPSVARSQLAETTAANQQQQIAMARSGSGPLGQAGNRYEAARNSAGINQAANRQAASLRAQEQALAMQGMGQTAGQMRGQDINMLDTEQGYQVGKAGVHAQVEAAKASQSESEAQRRANSSMFGMGVVTSLAGGLAVGSDERMKRPPVTSDENAKAPPAPWSWAGTPSAPLPDRGFGEQFNSGGALAPMPTGRFDPREAIDALKANQEATKPKEEPVDKKEENPAYARAASGGGGGSPYAQGQATGGVIGGLISKIPGLSDKRAKKPPTSGPRAGIPEADPRDMDRFLGDLRPYEFRYKKGIPGEDPNKNYVGVMAQDAERTKAGSSFVVDGPDGLKRLDAGHGFGTALAAMGRLNERLERLEQRSRSRRGGK